LVFSLAILFTVLVIWVQGITIFSSGVSNSQGNLIFHNYVLFQDSNVHLGLIGEMKHRFPPTNFAAGGIPLKNYHYLFDAVAALIGKISGIGTLDLYYRIIPIGLSILLSAVIYLTTYKLTKNHWTSALAIFFTVFSTSFGQLTVYVKNFFHLNSVTGGSNMYMTDQILDLLINPQSQLGIIIFLVLFLLLSWYVEKKKSIFLIVYALLLGFSFGVKAYGGIVFAPAAVLTSLWMLWRNRDVKPLIATFAGCFIMFLWIRATIDSGVAGMQFAPMWTIDKMMMDLDRLNEPRFYLLREHYLGTGNWVRLIMLYSGGITLYLVGSLGFRILGILVAIKLILNWKKISPATLFLLSAALVSWSIPIFPYATILSGILFSIFIFDITNFFKNRIAKLFVIVFFIFLTLVLISKQIIYRFSTPGEEFVISKEFVDAALFAKTNTPEDSIFLSAPTDFNFRIPIFSSLSERRTVYSCRSLVAQVGVDSEKTEKQLIGFFNGQDYPISFDYLVLGKSDVAKFARIDFKRDLSLVYQNSQISIWKRIKS